MTDQPLAVSTDGAVVRITMARPDRRNAFDAALIAALTVAFRVAPTRPGARVVVLAGEGASFSAGADLQWMRGSLELTGEQNRDDALALADMLAAIAECPLPVIARVQGHALGGGGGLLCAADIAIAAGDVQVGFPEVRLGIIAAAISPYVVRRIGAGAARAMFLTGRAAAASECLRVGLVHAIAPPDGLDDAVAATVRDIIAGGPEALEATKRLLDECSAPLAPGVREGTAGRIASIRVGTEAQAGIRAFLEGERAPWRT